MPHFEGKALGDAKFKDAGVPTTFMRTSFYWDNMIHLGMGPKKDETGAYKLLLPQHETDVLPGICAKDIGLCAAGIFKDPSLIGQTLGIVGEHVTCVQMAASLSKALGMTVSFQSVPFDTYRALGFPGADDLGNMFEWQSENNAAFVSNRDQGLSKKLNPELLDFEGFCQAYAKSIPT